MKEWMFKTAAVTTGSSEHVDHSSEHHIIPAHARFGQKSVPKQQLG